MLRPSVVLLSLCVALELPQFVGAQSAFTVHAKRLNNDDLAFVLLWGSPVDLQRVSGGSRQPLRVRLWQTPIERSCGPAGHLICAYQYHLAASEVGEGGKDAVYDLGEFGTIQSLRWLSNESDDRALLEISALNHPAHVFRTWPGLKRVQRTFILSIGTDSVDVRLKR
jgi:hypothetical protein